MGSSKHRLHNTESDNLIGNLRGEVGEVILSWILLRYISAQAHSIRTGDIDKDIQNQQLFILDTLSEKLEDEIAARLSELAQEKIGRLNFYFAYKKLDNLEEEVKDFSRFIEKSDIHRKRNIQISHKELPEKWIEHREIHIPYPILVKGVAMALRLMKKFDYEYIGPEAKFLWREMRKKRYDFTMPPRAAYLLLPYLRIPPEAYTAIESDPKKEESDSSDP